MRKIYIFELKKLICNKLLLVLAVSVIIILLLITTTIGYTFDKTPKKNISKDEMEEILVVYKKDIDRIDDKLASGDYLPSEEERLIKDKKMYEFFINTKTTEHEYLDITTPYNLKGGYLGTGFMFFFYYVSSAFIMIFSILAVLYVFMTDYTDIKIKNIYATTATRKDVYYGKMLFLLTLIFGFIILCFIYALIQGLTSHDANFLIYINDEFIVQNCIKNFLIRYIGLVVMIFCFTMITLISIVKFRTSRAAFTPLAICGLSIIGFLMLDRQHTVFGDPLLMQTTTRWIPVLNMLEHSQVGYTPTYAVIVISYLAITIGLYLLAKKIFLRQDI